MMLLILLLSLFVPSSDAAASAVRRLYNRVMHLFDHPPPGDWTTMTSAMCRGEAVPKLFANAGDIFKVSNEGTCKCESPHDGDKKRADFFSPTAADCDINWALDSTDKPGGNQCFPGGVESTDKTKTDWGAEAGKVPAILGFGGSITTLCGGDPNLQGNDSLEKCCMAKDHMYNRLWFNGDQPQHWTLCKNMKWLLCAAQGLLPGQKKGTKGGVIVLASAADTWGEQFRGKNDDTADKVSVTVHETCLLDRICSNSADMWTTKKNAEFECAYDPPAELKKAGAASGTKSGVEGSISSPKVFEKDDANKPPLKKEKHTSMMEETKVAITETSPISAPYLAFGGVISLALFGAFALGRFWSRKEEEAYHLLAEEL